MRRNIPIIILFWIVFSGCENRKMDFETYTKQLFLNADITKYDSSLLVYYKKHSNLKEVKYEGFTTYPPLSAFGQQEFSKKYIFQFKSHPKILFDFRDGELIVERRSWKGKQNYSPILKVSFDTKEQAEKAFQILINEFKEVTAKKRMREREGERIVEFTDGDGGVGKEIVVSYSGDAFLGYTLIIILANQLEGLIE